MPNTQSILHRLRAPFAALMLFGAAGIIAMVVALTASGGSPSLPKQSPKPVSPLIPLPSATPADPT
ncbi:MAG: hypothetical protein ABR564_02175, partial [Candidatus Dormibacteria bacterium]